MKSSMIDMKPKNAIKIEDAPLDKIYPEETVLPEDGLYQYLYQPDKQHGDQRRRATDFIWSKNTYRLDWIVENQGNHMLYYLKDGPNRLLAKEELMYFAEHTEVPPERVSEWK